LAEETATVGVLTGSIQILKNSEGQNRVIILLGSFHKFFSKEYS